MDIDSVQERNCRATSVLSMDDIEAAQALEGLRSEYGQSPTGRSSSLPHHQLSTAPNPLTSESEQEPLLSLLTSSHPLISSAINGSMSAYTSSKSYSPRFRYGAEFIERNIGSPVANTVGTVSRKTGVEGGIRWALQRRDTSDTNSDRSKRRKVGVDETSSEMDVEKGLPDAPSIHHLRSPSDISISESLPPYDDHRSPNYEDIDKDDHPEEENEVGERPSPTWQSRLMISTSGLGVAMSEESLRSLTYCLKWLKWANGRLSNSIVVIKNVLKQWDDSKQERMADTDENLSSHARLSQHVQAVKEDILRTLKQVVDIVSKYTGSALPENARNLVRRHLTSLPQRFWIASSSNPPPDSCPHASNEATSAHRVLVLAQEGLDMMAQVNRVVNDTLVSAELWCERLGRKLPDTKNANEGQQPEHESTPALMDVKQPIVVDIEQDVQMTTPEEVA
ncbi:Transcription factor Opi1 domain containing protein [Elaphomyces granulatus]